MTNLMAMPMPVAKVSARRAFVSADARHANFAMPSQAICRCWSHTTTNAFVSTSAGKALKAYGARRSGESST